ncbi:MAG: hypothetical protein U0703_21725 [Anaerolineae bacterium]
MSFVFYRDGFHVTAVCDDQLPANPDQSADEIEQLLTTRSQEHSAIWYVAQPQSWQNASVAQSWLETHLQPVLSTMGRRCACARFALGRDAGRIEGAPLATFGDAVQLVGVRTDVEDATGWRSGCIGNRW